MRTFPFSFTSFFVDIEGVREELRFEAVDGSGSFFDWVADLPRPFPLPLADALNRPDCKFDFKPTLASEYAVA